MGLREKVDAKTKTPTATVKYEGKSTRDVLSIDVSYSINNALNTATIRSLNRPPAEPEGKVIVTQGYDGKEVLVFTGLIDSIQQDEYATTYTVICRDMLKKAMDTFLVQEVKFGIDVETGHFFYSTYTNNDGGTFTVHEYESLSALNAAHPETTDNYSPEGVKAEAVVQWLLVMCGLAEGTEIQVDPTEFWLGDLSPATFHLQSVYDSIQQICELIGWYVFCDVGGVVRFKKRPRKASGYSVWKYKSTGEPYNIHSASYTKSNIDLRNYVEVQGASGIKVVKRSSSPYIGNTPYRGVLIGNDLIDTSGIAEFIANRVLSDLNRLKETVALEVDGNPYLFPGQSIDIRSGSANGTFMIEDIQGNVSADAGYRMNIAAAAYPGDSTDEDDGDIQAVITVTQVVSIGDPKILVQFDGSSSYSNRGPITAYDWQFGSSTYNKYGPEPQAWMVFDSEEITGTSMNVTLNVYDAGGNFATTTSGITLEGLLGATPLMYRQLYAALTTRGVGSQNGGDSWNKVEIPAISVAASNFAPGGSYTTTGYALFGGSDGKVYKTEDFAASVVEVVSLDGPVNHIHVAEKDSRYCLAVTEAGSLYKSIDSGVTWTLIKNFGFALKQAEFGYEDYNYITLVSAPPNPGAYISTDGGGTWIQLVDFGNVEMNWYAGGSATPYFAHTSGVVASRPQPDPLPFSGGAGPNVVAMTVAIDDDSGVMIVDDTGQHWNFQTTAGSGFIMTEDNSLNPSKHMVRDGDIPILAYYATQSGVGKSLDRNVTMLPLLEYPDEPAPPTGWGEMVAYGPLAPIEPPVFGRIVVWATDSLGPADNPGMLFTLSGYAGTGQPVYQEVPDLVGPGYWIAVSGGLCRVTSPYTTDNSRPMSAGPGYFIVADEYDSDAFAYPGTGAYPDRALYAIDFTGLLSTSGVVASGQFFPQFYPIKWYPKQIDETLGEVDSQTHYYVDLAQIAKNPIHNRAGGNKTRVYVGYQRRFQAVGGENYMEAFDIPRGALQAGTMLYTVSESVSPSPEGVRAGGIQYHTGIGRGDNIVFTYQAGSLLSPSTKHWYATFNAAGTPSFILDAEVPLESEDGYGPVSSTDAGGVGGSKFAAGWRAPVAHPRVLGGMIAQNPFMNSDFELLTGPSRFEPLSLTRPEIDGAPAPVLGFFASAISQSDLYYVTPFGLYRVPAYGSYTGLTETLFTPPTGWEPDVNETFGGWDTGTGIISAQVTYNGLYTRDYIVLIIGKRDSPGDPKINQQLVWSSDGGTTWEYGPIIRGGRLASAWWIEP